VIAFLKWIGTFFLEKIYNKIALWWKIRAYKKRINKNADIAIKEIMKDEDAQNRAKRLADLLNN